MSILKGLVMPFVISCYADEALRKVELKAMVAKLKRTTPGSNSSLNQPSSALVAEVTKARKKAKS